MANAPRDDNRVTSLLGISSIDGTTPTVIWADTTTHRLLVDSLAVVSGTVTANLSATDNAVLDDIAANQTDKSQITQLADGSGNIIGATSNALDVNIKSGSATLAVNLDAADDEVTIYGSDDGGTNRRIIKTDAGGAIQVDVESMPTTTVSATNLDIRDLTSVSDSVEVKQSTASNLKVDLSGTGANSTAIKVDGSAVTQPVSGTFWQATQPVSGTFWQATQPVSGTFWQATQPVSGTLAVTQSGTWDEVGINDSGNSITVDGTVTANGYLNDGADAGIKATVKDYTNSNPLCVTLTDTDGSYVGAGAGTQYTEGDTDATITGTAILWEDAANTLVTVNASKPLPVSAPSTGFEVIQGTAADLNVTEASASAIKTAVEIMDDWDDSNYCNVNLNVAGTDVTSGGGVEANSLRVTIASDSTGVLSVDDNGGALTVDGTVTANLSATDNSVLDSIDTSTASKYITGIGHGVKTVTTAGTDVALAASTPCKKVTIQAQTDNTNLIAVGGSGVDATEATGTGIILYPGDSYEFDIDNLADVYIDSLADGEGVRFTYFT